MIAITGTTGHLGRLVADNLIATVGPTHILATARNPEALRHLSERGVTVRRLDYDDPTTIAGALEQASQVLLISSSDIGRRVPQHRNVIDASVAVGVEHIAYTSILRAGTSTLIAAEEHAATERVLANAPIRSTLLRHGWYVENYTENLVSALANGSFVGCSGNGRIAAATRADYAAAAARVMRDATLHGRTYELAGPSFTMTELAALVSEMSGRTLPYVDISADQLRTTLEAGGLPRGLVEFLVDADLGIRAGQLDGSSSMLESLAGRPLTTLRTAIAAALH